VLPLLLLLLLLLLLRTRMCPGRLQEKT